MFYPRIDDPRPVDATHELVARTRESLRERAEDQRTDRMIAIGLAVLAVGAIAGALLMGCAV